MRNWTLRCKSSSSTWQWFKKCIDLSPITTKPMLQMSLKLCIFTFRIVIFEFWETWRTWKLQSALSHVLFMTQIILGITILTWSQREINSPWDTTIAQYLKTITSQLLLTQCFETQRHASMIILTTRCSKVFEPWWLIRYWQLTWHFISKILIITKTGLVHLILIIQKVKIRKSVWISMFIWLIFLMAQSRGIYVPNGLICFSLSFSIKEIKRKSSG